MKIFKQEIADGIGDLVKSTASIAYISEVSVKRADADNEITLNGRKNSTIEKVVAENQDQKDLYYLESVLVSTGWNKNDDVFLAKSTWEARNTPEDKQFNFMHDENDIIGHITGSYVLTKEGVAVADDAETPEEFDIVTQAVLYNSWMKPENKERMDKIIAEIPEGKWYVSMECLFGGFDYALVDPKGVAKILSRDESSAFLTKHLRAYGGTGEYEGYKIGRALSNISFSGKGLVSKPANPRSVILNTKTVASFNLTSDLPLSIGEINMSADHSILESQLAETKERLKAALLEVESAKLQIAEAKDKEFSNKITAYETQINDTKANAERLEELVKSTQARVAELEDALASSKDALAKAMKEMDEMKKKEKMQKRKAALLDAGLDQEEVDATLASFDSLEDSAFEAVAAMMKKKVAKKYDYDKEKDKSSDASVTPSLDNIGNSTATLVVPGPSPDEDLKKTQAAVASWFEKEVFNK